MISKIRLGLAPLLLVGAVASSAGADSADEAAPARDRIWQCFRFEVEFEAPVSKWLSTDNFDEHQVDVLRASWLCEEADKADREYELPRRSRDRGRIFECFDKRSETKGEPQHFRLETRNFDGHEVTVRHRSGVLCEEAGKGDDKAEAERNRPPEGRARVYDCFDVSGPDVHRDKALRTENFGPDDVTVREATWLCEEAGKGDSEAEAKRNRPRRSATPIDVRECFRLEDGQDPRGTKFLSTWNFGTHDSEVGRALRLCEKAAKRRLTSHRPEAPGRARCFTTQCDCTGTSVEATCRECRLIAKGGGKVSWSPDGSQASCRVLAGSCTGPRGCP